MLSNMSGPVRSQWRRPKRMKGDGGPPPVADACVVVCLMGEASVRERQQALRPSGRL
jgi:hypothetical protein